MLFNGVVMAWWIEFNSIPRRKESITVTVKDGHIARCHQLAALSLARANMYIYTEASHICFVAQLAAFPMIDFEPFELHSQ